MPSVALVTGANRGIGLEVTRQLAQQGMAVILGSRNLKKGEDAAKRFEDEGFLPLGRWLNRLVLRRIGDQHRMTSVLCGRAKGQDRGTKDHQPLDVAGPDGLCPSQ